MFLFNKSCAHQLYKATNTGNSEWLENQAVC